MNEPHRSSSIISKKKEKKKVTVKVQDTIIMGALLMSIVWLVLPSTLSIPIIPTNTIIPAAFATTTNGGGITCEGETATILGTNGNNDIVGTSGSDVIAGLGGNDRIRALGGDDIVCGGAGNDDMDGGEGRDELVGNQGNDRANGGAGNDICNAESEISCNEPDTTAPVLTVPEDITEEATSAEGAVVRYEVSAEDSVDGPVGVTCTPESGSIFSIGTTTTVTCTATDAAGNTGTASFTVTVQDTTPPVLTVPGNMRVEGGVVITWEVTAQDNIDGTATLDEENTLTQDDVGGDITLSCRPPSGTEFSSGVNSHGVSCTATDVADNTATASFRINTLL
jgi:hypothetical protein